ncbi:MAG: insulinase family protein [Candidatus Eiseniibacteriota bacterium]|nr:MAG: insulinase family protein [Candidatus Eisenbacteria bacterium]
MRNKSLSFILAVLLGVLLSVTAFAGKRPHPSNLTFPALTVTTPEVIDISLSNELTGFLVEDHEIPVVDMVLLVKTSFPDATKYGLNEMARWVIRNGGTATWPGEKLNDELEYLAASIEVYGDDLSTTISVNCLKRDLAPVLGIFADLVLNPAFPEDKVEMKRKTMLEDIRRKNDEPNAVASREFRKLIYKDHPYGWETTIESVNGIGRADLVEFRETYFYPNNAIIGISGDVTKDEVIAALEKAFAGWKSKPVAIPEVPQLEVTPEASCNYAYMDINQAYITLGHEGINSNDEERCAVNIMNFVLGGGSFTSWITEKVRSDEGLAYRARSRYSSDPWVKGMFTTVAQTKADACSRAITLITELIERMREVGPTEEEVEKAVDSYVNSHVFDYESKAQVVRRLVQLRFEGRPLDTPEKDMETYSKLSVADIRNAAQKYLHADRLTLLVVGNSELFDRPLSDFGTVSEIRLETD